MIKTSDKENWNESSNNPLSGPGTIYLPRAGMTLANLQSHLDKQGATNLVIELVIKNPSQDIFLKSVELGIALLEGGNSSIQRSMFNKLSRDHSSEKFFKVFFEKMNAAQSSIRSIQAYSNELMGPKKSLDDQQLYMKINRLSSVTRSGHNSFSDESNNRPDKPKMLWDQVKTYLIPKNNPETSRESRNINNFNDNNINNSRSPSIIATNDEGQRIVSDDHTTVESNIIPTLLRNHSLTPKQSITNDADEIRSRSESQSMPKEVLLMRPVMRYLQLLCENHNLELQNFLRSQGNKTNYNMVSETLKFLDCICGSTTGGLGLLGLYINENNVSLVSQTLETLTEYCQGPCHENQNCLTRHESNAIDIIIALILNDINPLGEKRMDLVLSLKNEASKLLLAIMESRADSSNAERIMSNMSGKQLIDAACTAFHQSVSSRKKDILSSSNKRDRFSPFNCDTTSPSLSNCPVINVDSEDSSTEDPFDCDDLVDILYTDSNVSPQDVGHNIYILCRQLSQHNKELCRLLDISNYDAESSTYKALIYYEKHTPQIEIVRSDRSMERIVFPVPQICEYLTSESKSRVFLTTEIDEQGSKVSDFFSRCTDLQGEMRWQKQLRTHSILYFISSNMSTWGAISFNLICMLNLLVILFYPFDMSININRPKLFVLPWMIFVSIITAKKRLLFLFASIICSIQFFLWLCDVECAIKIIGPCNVIITAVYLVSIMGNRGTFTKPLIKILTDEEILYHSAYLILCICGYVFHPMVYSVLLLHIVYEEETLQNVIRSATRNGRSIALTAVFAFILIYLFAIVGFIFFQDDFVMPTEPIPSKPLVSSEILENVQFCQATDQSGSSNCSTQSNKSLYTVDKLMNKIDQTNENNDEVKEERMCDTLFMCIITTLNRGLRNGGGIGDVLRSPSPLEPHYLSRVLYDMLFFFLLIVITLNLIFGVIIDTFADLRSQKQQKDETLRNTCFICGLERSAFNNKATSFDEHIRYEHNMWHYLYFIVLVRVKNPTEFTGPESYVAKMIQEKKLDWFPRMRAMSLDGKEEKKF